MGLIEAILDDVRRQGIEEGRQQVIEERLQQRIEEGRQLGIEMGKRIGVALEKRNSTLKLWDSQEFSLERIESLVGLSNEKIIEILIEHLQIEEGLDEETAKLKIEAYQQGLFRFR
jgi:hypothetical protein